MASFQVSLSLMCIKTQDNDLENLFSAVFVLIVFLCFRFLGKNQVCNFSIR